MIKKYYAHYTYIYSAGLFFKNYVVELDDAGYIKDYFPFEKETANTEYHSGLQLFVPEHTGTVNIEEIKLSDPVLNDFSEADILIRRFLV